MEWSDSIANIPKGWVLHNGENGPPPTLRTALFHADVDSDGTRNIGETVGSWLIYSPC